MPISQFADLISTMAVVISILYLAKQVRVAISSHNENHEWGRRVETKRALDSYNRLESVAKLQTAFDYLKVRQPIDTDLIEERITSDPELRVHLLRLLNYYEGLANGIDLSIYDESIIKETRRNNMTRTHVAFEKYMDHFRYEHNPRAYIKFRALIQKWIAEGETGIELHRLGTIK